MVDKSVMFKIYLKLIFASSLRDFFSMLMLNLINNYWIQKKYVEPFMTVCNLEVIHYFQMEYKDCYILSSHILKRWALVLC